MKHFRSKNASHPVRRLGGRRRRLTCERLETRCVLTAPFVATTTPDLAGSPFEAGMKSLKVQFSETVLGADNPANFDLRNSGADGTFGTDDDRAFPVSISYVGRTASLSFAVLPAADYRLTVSDAIVDDTNNRLDGDRDGQPGGAWQGQFAVIPGPASKIALGDFPATVTAGETHPLAVTMLDAYGNIATGYQGTVAFTSKDQYAALPPNYTFTAADAGVKSFPVTLNTPNTGVWIRVTDVAAGFYRSVTGITVEAAATPYDGPVNVVIAGDYPSPTEAGVSQKFTVAIVDSAGAVVPDFAGTVTFASTDPLADLPADYAYTLADGGVREFNATFKTAGSHTLTVSIVGDASASDSQSGILTEATVVDRFLVSGFPSPTVAGQTHQFTVVAADRYGNPNTRYMGTVTFTSSDANAILPADYTFQADEGGRKTFSATLRNTGSNRSITVTDTADSTITGRQAGIVVEQSFVRYSKTSNIIYVEDGHTVTLSDIHFIVPGAPLTLIDAAAGVWKLDANIRVVDGSTLLLHGAEIGGDVNELRLKSENTTDAHAFVEIRADYGNIDIRSTKVTSWDSTVHGPDTEHQTYGRAFVRARSRLASDGVTALESRMDIHESEIAYLGYAGSEAYGLSWKVLGDPGPNFELYDKVNIYGDIINSSIHHNYFGVYTYGAYGMQIRGNEVAHNVLYGLDPHDDSDSLVIENNFTHHNGTHGIIGSKRCDNLIIRGNISTDNGGNGIMLHRSTDHALVENNTVLRNGDSGLAIFDSRNNVFRNNTSQFNKHGIRLSVGAADNLIFENILSDNIERGINFFQGNDTPSAGDDGRPKRNTFRGNQINGNGSYAVRARDADDNVFEFNTFLNNGSRTLLFETAVGNLVQGNTVDSNALLKVTGSEQIRSLLYVAAQPGIEYQVDAYSSVVFLDGSSDGGSSGEGEGSRSPTAESLGRPALVVSNDAGFYLDRGIAQRNYNRQNRFDVDGSGEASLNDLLLTIARLRERGPHELPFPKADSNFYDVNATDNWLTIEDVRLLVGQLRDLRDAGAEENPTGLPSPTVLFQFPREAEDAEPAGLDEPPTPVDIPWLALVRAEEDDDRAAQDEAFTTLEPLDRPELDEVIDLIASGSDA